MVCCVQPLVAQKAADHSDISSGRDQHHARRVTKAVWADVFFCKRRHALGCPLNVLIEFEPNTHWAQWTTVAVDKNLLVLGARLSLQQRLDQFHCLRPQWTDAGLATFTEEFHLGRGIKADGRRRDIERFLDPRSGVV